ncbi:MAG: hypothetical protein V4451_04610 [Pseudomonadota bacterium]
MIDIKNIIKLASGQHSNPLFNGIVFDGRNAISIAHAVDPQPWWAGVPCEQKELTEPVGVPVEAIKAHYLRSRHLHVNRQHLHNDQGMKTEWSRKIDWNNAITMMPGQPAGVPVLFQLELDALDRVLVAAGDADTRMEGALNGVLLDFTTGRIVGTDGARLHMFDGKVPKLQPKKGQGPLHVILPKEAARWLLHSADEKATVQVWGLGDKQPLVLLRTSDGLVYTKAIAAKFPDYMRIMVPRPVFRTWVELNPAQMADQAAAMEKLHLLEKPSMTSVGVHWGQSRIYAGLGPNFVPVPFNLAGPDAGSVNKEMLFQYFQPRWLADLADCVTPLAHWCLHAATPIHPVHKQGLQVFEGDFSAILMTQRMGDTPPTDKRPKQAPKPAKTAKPAPVPVPVPAKPVEPPKPAPKAPEPAKAAPVAPKAPLEAQKPAKTGPKASKPAPAAVTPTIPAKPAEKAPAKPAPVRRSLKGEPAK